MIFAAQASAWGKAILVGEHAVVYGFKALAIALPKVSLKITMEYETNNTKSMSNISLINWETTIQNKAVVVENRIQNLLSQAFLKALALMENNNFLMQYSIKNIKINSQIPLGGGMGGSAAISSCLIKIAANITKKPLSFEQEISFANEVDSLFHDKKASGLDVATVASQGIIAFQKEVGIRKINNTCKFWIVLVDSGERSETAVMIQKVKNSWEKNMQSVEKIFHSLNNLAQLCEEYLKQGQLINFAHSINKAHEYLDALGVSTLKINLLVQKLKDYGALGAKITGAGGGGLVLGIFAQEPQFLNGEFEGCPIYLSNIL